MPDNRFVLRLLRKEDFLDLTFEFINVHAGGEPQRLWKTIPDQPALFIVHFPPQHLAEEAFTQSEDRHEFAGPVPVKARLSGPSRLVFKLQDDRNEWPLNIDTLLDWHAYEPVLASNALPPGAASGPGPGKPGPQETALEVPAGLYLSPDRFGAWFHSATPVGGDGRYELWHTRLAIPQADADGSVKEGSDMAYSRVIGTTGASFPFETSLNTSTNSFDARPLIAKLSSDFSMPSIPLSLLPQFLRWQDSPLKRIIETHWKQRLAANGLPLKYTPSPVLTRRLMLSPAGAWANLESAWDYPTITGSNASLGYDSISLEQWQHIASQGRDQYVKTVRKGFLCDTGHRVSVVTITKREFEPMIIRTEQTEDGPVAVFGSTAYLRKYSYIVVQEPIKDYGPMADLYTNGGRENPFKRIHITTRSTPMLDKQQSNMFWPTINGTPFRFQMIAEDAEGKTIHMERPLLCVILPDNQTGIDWAAAQDVYNLSADDYKTVPLQAQSLAFTETLPTGRGKSSLKVDSLKFAVQLVQAADKLSRLPYGQPPILPQIVSAQVNLPAVERITGSAAPVTIKLAQPYLEGGMAAELNPGEVFAEVEKTLSVTFPAERAGGLLKPDMAIEGLSRLLGPVGKLDPLTNQMDLEKMFGQASFLGSITLTEILDRAVSLEMDNVRELDIPLNELVEKLDRPDFFLKIPMLTSREIYPPGVDPKKPNTPPIAIETQYLWKPKLQPYESIFSFLPQTDGQFVLRSILATPLKPAEPASFEIFGKLEHFVLDFAGAVKLAFESLHFRSVNGKKPDVSADGLSLTFDGPLKFVETLKNIIPTDGFSDPPFLDVNSSGIRAGYTLSVPTVNVGIFSLQNLSLGAALTIPFINQPAGIRFNISERQKPFLVTVGLFGGSGFFALALNANGIEQIEAAIEFGGSVSLDLGVASGGISVMAGIYFGMDQDHVNLTGYLRCGGHLSVLGLISLSVEFYLAFQYLKKNNGKGEVWGQATVTVCIDIGFFSKSVDLTVERRFAGAAGDPTFGQLVEPDAWASYCDAFA